MPMEGGMSDLLNGISASQASAITQKSVASDISTRVLAKQQSVEKQQGEAAVSLIKAALKNAPGPSAGGGIDVQA